MAYATFEEFRSLMPDSQMAEAEAVRMLEQASDDIDGLCFGRIRKHGFEKLTAFQQEKVKKKLYRMKISNLRKIKLRKL